MSHYNAHQNGHATPDTLVHVKDIDLLKAFASAALAGQLANPELRHSRERLIQSSLSIAQDMTDAVKGRGR